MAKSGSDRDYSFDGYLPYYVQLRSILEDRITKGEFNAGDQLPSESEICTEFKVSRTVVRQALQEMEFDGVVVKKKGKGTFVAEPKLVESFVQTLSGFHEDMVSQQKSTHSIVLRQDVIKATERIAQMLGIITGTQTVLLRRLRFVEKDPIQLVSSYLPYDLCPDLVHTDFSQRSLYAFLEDHGIFLATGYRTIEAVRASADEGSLLKIESGAPLIRIESIGYSEDGTPVEFYEAVHRGDRTRFRVELVRERVHTTVRGKRSPKVSAGAFTGLEVLPRMAGKRKAKE